MTDCSFPSLRFPLQVVVAESCDVALDILDYETSDSFQYADVPVPASAN